MILALQAPNELARLRTAAACIDSVSIDGQIVERGESGFLRIPNHMVEDILTHIFTGGAGPNGNAA